MEDKEKQQYKNIIDNLRAENDKLINILKDTLVREQEGNKATVEAMQSIVESYNKKEKNIITGVIIAFTVILMTIYIF